MSSNPAPGYVPGGDNTGNRVYYPRPDERIHACCLYVFKPTGPGDHHVHSFVFFLNVKMFLDEPRVPAANTQRKIDIYPVTRNSSRPSSSTAANQPTPSLSSTPSSSSQSQSQTDSLPDHYPHPYQLFAPHPSFFTPVNIQQQLAFPPPPTQAAISRSRQMHLRSLLISSGVKTIPWEEWGPQNTRWFDEALSTDWQHALYGLKTVECIDPFNPPLPVPVDPGDVSARFDAVGDDDDTSAAPPPVAPPVDTQTLPTVNDLLNGIGFDVVDDDDRAAGDTSRQRMGPAQRHLRIRDYNPYSLRIDAESHLDGDEAEDGKGKGKAPAREPASRWTRRIVTTQSTTPSRGVFVKDIVSSLPYSEVISKEKFNVTDVMMDDCRVLLMQVSTQCFTVLLVLMISSARKGRKAKGDRHTDDVDWSDLIVSKAPEGIKGNCTSTMYALYLDAP
jgi:hypothetical protein